eukprot:GHVS01100033.1.p1 GENE.GHVS01100033.1~~GHVS01100033.1.p1  ORF type:complete len:249 (+),score=18.90 GHVS01100033.1:78-824(+)
MKGWKMFSLWAGLSSSYANAVTFLTSTGESEKVDSNGFYLNDRLDGSCNVHGSILNDTPRIAKNLLSEVKEFETQLQNELENGNKTEVLKSLIGHIRDTSGSVEVNGIEFVVKESFPNGSCCRLTDKDGNTYFTDLFNFSFGHDRKGAESLYVQWGHKQPIPVWNIPTWNKTMLDPTARGSWCSLKLRGLDLPKDAVVGYISDEKCLVTLVFDAKNTGGVASYIIGDKEVEEKIDICWTEAVMSMGDS